MAGRGRCRRSRPDRTGGLPRRDGAHVNRLSGAGDGPRRAGVWDRQAGVPRARPARAARTGTDALCGVQRRGCQMPWRVSVATQIVPPSTCRADRYRTYDSVPPSKSGQRCLQRVWRCPCNASTIDRRSHSARDRSGLVTAHVLQPAHMSLDVHPDRNERADQLMRAAVSAYLGTLPKGSCRPPPGEPPTPGGT